MNALILVLMFAAQVMGPISKAMIVWEWDQGDGPGALGFHVYCGPKSNHYTAVSDVPDPKARSLLALETVMKAVEWNKEDLAQPFCTVVPYNKAGEARSGIKGAPRDVKSVNFVMQ